MKVAIMFDERDGWYRAYKYSWFFRLFGADCCCVIAVDCSTEEVIESAKKKIHGKITLIRIVEL